MVITSPNNLPEIMRLAALSQCTAVPNRQVTVDSRAKPLIHRAFSRLCDFWHEEQRGAKKLFFPFF